MKIFNIIKTPPVLISTVAVFSTLRPFLPQVRAHRRHFRLGKPEDVRLLQPGRQGGVPGRRLLRRRRDVQERDLGRRNTDKVRNGFDPSHADRNAVGFGGNLGAAAAAAGRRSDGDLRPDRPPAETFR